jgi:carbon-monoxide dehydrogenase medium subunit
MMKLRLVSPEYIVDINRIPGLDYISESDGHLRIGALTREHELESSDEGLKGVVTPDELS